MEWISNAKFKQELTEGSIFRLKGQADICIHTIHGLGNEFYLSCGRLGIQSFGLNTENFDVAVENTKVIIGKKMNMLNELYTDFIANDSGNVFVRY